MSCPKNQGDHTSRFNGSFKLIKHGVWRLDQGFILRIARPEAITTPEKIKDIIIAGKICHVPLPENNIIVSFLTLYLFFSIVQMRFRDIDANDFNIWIFFNHPLAMTAYTTRDIKDFTSIK